MTKKPEEMRRTWLVQRLQKPRRATPFDFGGGLRNGGLSDDAMNLLSGVFSFDYMGAAEFEYGAVPKAIQRLAEATLSTHSFTVPVGDIHRSLHDEEPAIGLRNTIHVICPKGWESEIESRLREWAKKGYVHLKEQPLIHKAMQPTRDWDLNLIGWLELDNGWFAFVDEEAFRKTCGLFAIDPELATP